MAKHDPRPQFLSKKVTPRVAAKPAKPAQSGAKKRSLGPDVRSKKRTTKKKDAPKRVAKPVAKVAAPVETIKVQGERVDVVALPSKLDPTEVKPSKRDTLEKDRLRSDGKAKIADAPVRRDEGGDWLHEKVELT